MVTVSFSSGMSSIARERVFCLFIVWDISNLSTTVFVTLDVEAGNWRIASVSCLASSVPGPIWGQQKWW